MADNGLELDLTSIEDYLNGVKNHFNILDKNMNAIERKAMSKAGSFVKREIKKSYRMYFPNKPRLHSIQKLNSKYNFPANEPSNLFESIKSRSWKKPGLGQIIYAPVHSPWNAILYGFALHKGFTHKVNTKDGYHTVTVKPVRFLTGPGERALTNQSLYRDMDRTIQAEFDKIQRDPAHYKIIEEREE